MLAIALFLTLNEAWWHIEGIPTTEEMFGNAGLSESVPVTESGGVLVHFIDVGQGDCELIMTPDKNILIDCGEWEYADRVIAYLKAQGVTRLDYVIVTHPHSDHAGGMSYILDEFPTDTVIMPKLQDSIVPTTSTYTRLLKAISRNKIKAEYAKAGTEYDLGNNCRMEILAPVADYEGLNDYSVVMKFTHGENSFLFTGDIEELAENDIMDSGADLSADVIKVPHHCSSTSSSKKFIKAVSPKYAVIEVGSPNSYNHPHKSVLKRYQKVAEVYRTDLNGNIVFVSNGESLEVNVSKGGE